MDLPNNMLGNLQRAFAANVKFAPQEAIGNFINGLPFKKHQFLTTQDVKKQMLKRPSAIYNRPGAPFAAIIPGDSVVETVTATGLLNFLSLYNSALIIRLVLTWFPNPPEVIEGPLATICDPYLNLFRGLIPPLGGTLDFSPILAFVVLSVFTNAAAALPCELGPDGHTPIIKGTADTAQQQQRPALDWAPLSKFQQAWAQRVVASKQQAAGNSQP